MSDHWRFPLWVTLLTALAIEFVVRFDLFDPTNIASSGLSVCLFEKTRKALPEPAAGDIVLLRSVAVSLHARILETWPTTHFILG